MCGHSSDVTPTSDPQTSAWASFMYVNSTSNDLRYIRDYKFDDSGKKRCEGIYSDGRHMYVLVVSDHINAGHFQPFVYMKDIVYFTDDHLQTIDLAPSAGAVSLAINSFVVKSENGVKTLFIGGSINNALNGLSLTSRANIIEKFSVNITNFTCLTQTSLDNTRLTFMTRESNVQTFVGTTQTTGLWVDSTKTISVYNLGK